MGSDGKLPPLRDQVILYIDASERSTEVKKLLNRAGVSFFETAGSVGPLQRKPALLYGGAVYQGVEEIQGFVRLLEHWNLTGLSPEIFCDDASKP